MSEVKYAKYRIVQNSESAYWKYQVQARSLWPLPFWFDKLGCDHLKDAHWWIERRKTKSKVVYIE